MSDRYLEQEIIAHAIRSMWSGFDTLTGRQKAFATDDKEQLARMAVAIGILLENSHREAAE